MFTAHVYRVCDECFAENVMLQRPEKGLTNLLGLHHYCSSLQVMSQLYINHHDMYIYMLSILIILIYVYYICKIFDISMQLICHQNKQNLELLNMHDMHKL